MITILDKNYVETNMPAGELPVEYHYLRDLIAEETNNTGLEGCANKSGKRMVITTRLN